MGEKKSDTQRKEKKIKKVHSKWTQLAKTWARQLHSKVTQDYQCYVAGNWYLDQIYREQNPLHELQEASD